MLNAKRPLFSIIIPTRNRPQQLRRCLAACARLDFPRDQYEVIVVDDGSTPPLPADVTAAAPDVMVQLLRQPNQGPAAARNAGATAARGTYLAFTDDDCAPDSAWLQGLHAALANGDGLLVGGRTVNALTDNLFATASQLLIDYLYAYFGVGAGAFFTSNNMAAARRAFFAADGFAETMPLAAGEDRELCDRWRAHGGRLLFAPAAVVQHAHALTAVSFWRQHWRYGRGAYDFHQLRAQRRGTAVHLEPGVFYLRLLGYPLARMGWGKRPLLLTLLLGVSQLANGLGFFSAAWRARRRPKQKSLQREAPHSLQATEVKKLE